MLFRCQKGLGFFDECFHLMDSLMLCRLGECAYTFSENLKAKEERLDCCANNEEGKLLFTFFRNMDPSAWKEFETRTRSDFLILKRPDTILLSHLLGGLSMEQWFSLAEPFSVFTMNACLNAAETNASARDGTFWPFLSTPKAFCLVNCLRT